MKIIRKDQKRTVYGWTENDIWFLSPFDKSVPRRPINRYDSKEELLDYAQRRGVMVEFEDNG